MVMGRNARVLYTTALAVFILDQATKMLVRELLPIGSSVSFGIISITHVQNIGIAFGLLQFYFLRWVFVAFALGVAFAIAWSCYHRKLTEHLFAWGLIMGGAIGNALDRVFFRTVTDFIDFHVWPAFNIADSALTIGVLFLIWHSLRK